MKNVRLLFVLIVTSALSAMMVSAQVDEPALQESGEALRITFVVHGQNFGAFWPIVKAGIDAAAADLGAEVDYHAVGYNATSMTRRIDNAVEDAVDGLVVSIPLPDELRPSITAAVEAGVPVIAINQGTEVAADLGALAYIGQAEYQAGFAGGERLAAAGAVHGLCVNHGVGIAALDSRCQGFADAMQAVGGEVEILPVDEAQWSISIEMIAQILNDGPEIDAIFSMGAGATFMTVAALQETDHSGPLQIASFDLAPEFLEPIRDGRLLFAVDQQPYLQGYLAVVYMKLYHDNLNTPGSFFIPTGPGFVTSENVEAIMNLSAAGTR